MLLLKAGETCSITRLRRGFVGLALALALGAAAPASYAQAPSLTGESLEAHPGVLPGHETSFGTFTCNKDGTTTIPFEARGIALGPYTGTFEESGTVTIGPQTDTTIDSLGVGAIVGFQATFSIVSEFPPGTVTGTKSLVSPPPTGPSLAGGFGRCDPDGSEPPNDVFVFIANANVLYEAQINATTGSRSDSGNAGLVLRSTPPLGATDTFLQVFNSTEPVPPVGCDEDDGKHDDKHDGKHDEKDCDDEDNDDQGEN